jgi:hypothetical protein
MGVFFGKDGTKSSLGRCESPPEVDLFIPKIQFYSNFRMVPPLEKGVRIGKWMVSLGMAIL